MPNWFECQNVAFVIKSNQGIIGYSVLAIPFQYLSVNILGAIVCCLYSGVGEAIFFYKLDEPLMLRENCKIKIFAVPRNCAVEDFLYESLAKFRSMGVDFKGANL